VSQYFLKPKTTNKVLVFGSFSLCLKFCKGSSIFTKEKNLRFSIETPLPGELTFNLVFNSKREAFSIFQEKKQRNDYSVQIVNNTTYVIKNGQVIYENQSSIPEEISVEFASSEDVFWTVFNVHGYGSGKDFKVDCSSSDSNEYTIEEIFNDLQIAQKDSFSVNGDSLRFLINSPTPGNLSILVQFDKDLPILFSTRVEVNRWSDYNVLHLNSTICIIQNGFVVEQKWSRNSAKKVYVLFPPNSHTLYTSFKEHGRETSKSSTIQPLTYEEVSTEVFKAHVTKANDYTIHEEYLENQNSDDSKNTQKCPNCNNEATDSSTLSSTDSSTVSSTDSSTVSSTESSTKALSTENNDVLIIISVIVVIIVMTAIGCNDIIKRYKYNHAESNDETQNLQQVDAEDTEK
jgi:hypothetical protein